MRERSWWGWGYTDAAVAGPELSELAARVGALLPLDGDITPVPTRPTLPPPRVRPPASLDSLVVATDADRAAHTYGKAYRDVIRALRGDVAAAPDLVAYPRTEADVEAVLDWAADYFVVPFGGGSSVQSGSPPLTHRLHETGLSQRIRHLLGEIDPHAYRFREVSRRERLGALGEKGQPVRRRLEHPALDDVQQTAFFSNPSSRTPSPPALVPSALLLSRQQHFQREILVRQHARDGDEFAEQILHSPSLR